MKNVVIINRQVRNLILDYSLGAVIITLVPIPIPKIAVGKILVLAFLNYRMIRGIRRIWKFHKGGDFLARIGSIFGLIGSVSLSIMIWVGIIILSFLIPQIYVLASGASIFAYFWGVGQTVHHFHLSGFSEGLSDES